MEQTIARDCVFVAWPRTTPLGYIQDYFDQEENLTLVDGQLIKDSPRLSASPREATALPSTVNTGQTYQTRSAT